MVSHGVGQVKLIGMGADWFDDLERSMEFVLQLLVWPSGVYVAAVKPNHISRLVAESGGSGTCLHAPGVVRVRTSSLP